MGDKLVFGSYPIFTHLKFVGGIHPAIDEKLAELNPLN